MQILTSAEDFRRQAQHHEEIARKLNEVADSLEGKSNGSTHRISGRRAKGGGTRLEELKKYLIDHGPTTRQDLIDKSGLPAGTIAGLLNPANGFEKGAQKLWHLKKA